MRQSWVFLMICQLLEDMQLFNEWFLQRWLGYDHARILNALQDYYELLIVMLGKAPVCCVHRDFHSRNLCILSDDSIGVLDYQDASQGHFCYDLVSLLKDAYNTFAA